MGVTRRSRRSGHACIVAQELAGAKGSYVLVMRLEDHVSLRIGRLGTFGLSPGNYLYFGSALSGVEHRVLRHLRRNKKRHWHIDFFTRIATVAGVWWTDDGQRSECRWASAVTDVPGAVAPVPRFGSSDCSCNSHLAQVPTAITIEKVCHRIEAVTPGLTHLDLDDDTQPPIR